MSLCKTFCTVESIHFDEYVSSLKDSKVSAYFGTGVEYALRQHPNFLAVNTQGNLFWNNLRGTNQPCTSLGFEEFKGVAEKAFTLPKEYEAFLHLQLGDLKTVEYCCRVWNSLQKEDNLRMTQPVAFGEIGVTGKCSDVEEFLDICKYLTSCGVTTTHKKTIITMEI